MKQKSVNKNEEYLFIDLIMKIRCYVQVEMSNFSFMNIQFEELKLKNSIKKQDFSSRTSKKLRKTGILFLEYIVTTPICSVTILKMCCVSLIFEIEKYQIFDAIFSISMTFLCYF